MTKNTYDLYRCSPLLWTGLEYEDALHFRIKKAEKAKNYYRNEVVLLGNKNPKKTASLVHQYLDSDKAVKWNQKLLEEISEYREEIKNENKEL